MPPQKKAMLVQNKVAEKGKNRCHISAGMYEGQHY